MPRLDHVDKLHLRAAEGWIDLGNVREALKELEGIPRPKRTHRKVLELQYQVCVASNQWDGAVRTASHICKLHGDPDGWVHLANAIDRSGRTPEARMLLILVSKQFQTHFLMAYTLARLSCRLAYLKEAQAWFEKAFELGDIIAIKDMAMSDPDMAPLWSEIQDL